MKKNQRYLKKRYRAKSSSLKEEKYLEEKTESKGIISKKENEKEKAKNMMKMCLNNYIKCISEEKREINANAIEQLKKMQSDIGIEIQKLEEENALELQNNQKQNRSKKKIVNNAEKHHYSLYPPDSSNDEY